MGNLSKILLSIFVLAAGAAVTKFALKEKPTKAIPLAAIAEPTPTVSEVLETEIVAEDISQELSELSTEKEIEIEEVKKPQIQAEPVAKSPAKKVSKSKSLPVKAKKVETVQVEKTDTVSTKAAAVTGNLTTGEESTVTADLPSNFLKRVLGNNVGLTLEMTYDSSLFESDDPRYSATTSYLVNPTYRLFEKTTLGGYFLFNKGLTELREEEFSSSNFLYVSQRFFNFGYEDMFSLSASFRGYLPFNSEVRDNDTFRTRLYARPALIADMGKVGLTGLRLGLRLAYSKYFHEFETKNSGAVNTSYSLSPQMLVLFSATDKLSWNTLFAISDAWTYLGTRKDEQYQLDTSLSYQLTGLVSITAGYVNQGSTFTPDGESLDIKLFDPERGSVYSTLTLSL